MTAEKKTDAWMPLWIGAYLADTMKLTTQQHGAYLLLLIAYWRNHGPLDDDDEDLASTVKASASEWKKLRPKLEGFFTIEGGKWIHGRADKELSAAGMRKAAASSKASKGAEARWGKTSKQATGNALSSTTSNASSMPQALLEHVPKQCPTPSPIQIPSGSCSDPDGSGAAAPPPPPSDLFDDPPPPPDPPPVKAVDVIFGLGVPLLTKAGITEANARSFLGLQRRQARNDERVADAIRRAIEEQAIQPLEFIVGVLKSGPTPSSKHAGFDAKDYHAGANADGSF